MRKFAVCIEWNYRGTPEQQFEHCIVAPATPEDEEHDGDNCVGGRGADGFEFSVHNSLAEAILNTGYNPFKMTFEDLSFVLFFRGIMLFYLVPSRVIRRSQGNIHHIPTCGFTL